jgi:hypothetical protein
MVEIKPEAEVIGDDTGSARMDGTVGKPRERGNGNLRVLSVRWERSIKHNIL